MCKCRLKWAGLLPFVRLVEATHDEVEGEQEGIQIRRLQYDTSLLSCLVDRWRPETHTFHFRWGEMAPTLQDVSFLLGLPLEGDPIGPLREPPANWQLEMAERFDGLRHGQSAFDSEDHGPKVAWLQNFEVSMVTFLYCSCIHLVFLWLHLCLFCFINADRQVQWADECGTDYPEPGGIHIVASREGDVHRDTWEHYLQAVHPYCTGDRRCNNPS